MSLNGKGKRSKKKVNKFMLLIIIVIICILFTTMCKNSKKTTELIQLKNNGSSQMMGYIIKTNNNKIIAIDGGTSEDTENFVKSIKQNGGKVDYWFITHPYKNHASVIIDVINNPDIKIGKIYVTLNDKDWYKNNGDGRGEEAIKLIDTLNSEKIKNKVDEVSLNQKIKIDNIECEILGVKNPEITTNAVNNSSMVIKMKTNKNTLLFLSDTGKESSEKLLQNQKDRLKADIVQMANHGQSGATEELYEAVNPKICLWPTPEWLWNNDSGKGEDSGNWRTKETRTWMEEMNVEQNYIEKDGDIKISI